MIVASTNETNKLVYVCCLFWSRAGARRPLSGQMSVAAGLRPTLGPFWRDCDAFGTDSRGGARGAREGSAGLALSACRIPTATSREKSSRALPLQLHSLSTKSLCDPTTNFGCKKPNTRVNLADKGRKGLHISSNASAIQIVRNTSA